MVCKSPKYRKTAGCVVACGQCTPCLLKKQREKSSRVLLEDRNHDHDNRLFVTLTYDDVHLPTQYLHTRIDPETGVIEEKLYQCPSGTLRPDHLTNFLKRLRYRAALQNLKIRSVYAGEYGDDKRRPHYHLILWGIPYADRQLINKSWIDKDKSPMCDPKYLDIQIPKNDRHVANYLAKYLLSGENKKDSPALNGAYPQFYRTSKGLGLQYAEGVANALKKQSGLANLWNDGKLPSSFFFDGKNYPLDRYMRQKIYALLPSVFSEELPKAALEDYKAEMQLVYETAQMDEAFREETQNLDYATTLEKAVARANAPKAYETELKAQFFTSKRRPQNV